MSPKTPIRPGVPVTGQVDTPAIRHPEISPATRPRLPGSGSPVLSGTPGQLPAATPAATAAAQLPGAAPVVISSISAAVASLPARGRPLSAYSRPAPRGLPAPDSDGFRVVQQRQFVNLEDGRVVMVRYDDNVRSYCAQTREEHRPSGPALYRVEGSDIWKENRAASLLRQYQLSLRHLAATLPGTSPTAGGRPEAGANDQALRHCRALLLADAGRFFKSHSVPERPPLSAPGAAAGPRALIEALYRNSEGVVLGENLTDAGSKLFLVTHMATLAEQGVRTLYLERLRTDVEQVHLDTFHKSGTLSNALDDHLRTLDGDYGNAPSGTCSYHNLISTARVHGIRVQALDCAASDSLRVLEPEMLNRATALNYHACQVIQADRVGGRQGKWLALVDIHHAKGYSPQGTPGLARLQGVTAVEVNDTVKGPAIEAVPVPRLKADDPMRLVKPDLRLSVKLPWREALEIPPAYRKALRERIRNPEEIVRRTHVRIGERAGNEEGISDFLRRAQHLEEASADFFQWYSGNRRGRPETPQLPADSPSSRILERLYENNTGLVLGAERGATTARKFLIDNMQTLAALQVEKLYVQSLLTDLDQPFIDSFHTTGTLPRELENALLSEDPLWTPGDNGYTLRRLLISAREHGIKVQALDTATSYRKRLAPYDAPSFNYIAHKIIDDDQQQQGDHKWLALVLNLYASNVRGIPGLAQLQGAPGLRIVAMGPGATTQVKADHGEIVSVHDRHVYLRSDLVLELASDAAPPARAVQNPRSCLGWREGSGRDFLIEKQGANFILVQKSYQIGRDAYLEKVIEVKDGKYLMPPGTIQLQSLPYDSLADLVWGLRSENYVQVAEIPGVIPAVPRLDTHPQLHRPGMFLFDETANGTVLVHRSRNRALSVTPVRRNPAGKLYISHARWGYDETNLFDSLDEIGRHLIRDKGMTRYIAPADR
ncbi:membrane-targeted effector domain-containing toxin [Pseudomonas gingeri]